MSLAKLITKITLGLGCSVAISPPQDAIAADSTSLSVMTYNIRGLPWPLALGRRDAFAKIESRLQALRKRGAQPRVIVLQEAFTDDAKGVAERSGYRFVANGPSRDLPSLVRPNLADLKFSGAARFIKGETSGKLTDSGLQIASDYPILSVRRMAFPAFACAGYDCLANKGVLLVTVAVPGSSTPIAIATTHLNSKRSSRVSLARSLYAYQRQVAMLDSFLAANHDPDLPIIFAGDFNASTAARRSYLISRATTRWSRQQVSSALQNCMADAARRGEKPHSLASKMVERGRDWQFYIPGVRTSLQAIRLVVPFGLERDGSMLSDHIGYGIIYRLHRARRAT
jgi:endonuclease/exonuclease/phosphatase family metal-dependent hydrolase